MCFLQRWTARLSIQHMKKTCCLLHFRNKSSLVLIIQRFALRLGSLMSWGMTEGTSLKRWKLTMWPARSFEIISKYMCMFMQGICPYTSFSAFRSIALYITDTVLAGKNGQTWAAQLKRMPWRTLWSFWTPAVVCFLRMSHLIRSRRRNMRGNCKCDSFRYKLSAF